MNKRTPPRRRCSYVKNNDGNSSIDADSHLFAGCAVVVVVDSLDFTSFNESVFVVEKNI